MGTLEHTGKWAPSSTKKDKEKKPTPKIVQKDRETKYIMSMTNHRQDFKL